jgi:hypothetical protein
MSTPPSPRAALVAYLKADPDVFTQTAGRVFGASLPGSESTSMPRKAVVVQSVGGSERVHSPQYRAQFDIRTYGATPAEADELQRVCRSALKRLSRVALNGALLYSAVMLTGSYAAIEETTYWPFHFSTWAVETHYQEV